MNNLKKVQTISMRLISPLIRSNLIRNRMFCTANKSTNEQHERTASFGYQTVPENEKAEKGSLICMSVNLIYKISIPFVVFENVPFIDLFIDLFIFCLFLFELKCLSLILAHTHAQCTKYLKMWPPHMI